MKLSHLFVTAAVFVAACGQTSCSGGSFSEQFADVDLIPVKLEKEGKWSLVNPDGKVVYDGEFANRPSCAINGYFSVKEGEGYTLYKIGGKNPVAVDGLEDLYRIGYVNDGLIPATVKNSRISVMKPTGELVFELTPYKDAEIVECSDAYSEGMLCFETENGKYGFYDTKGEVAIPPVYDYAHDFKEGLAIVGKKDNKTDDRKYIVIDKNGETVFKIKDGVDIETYRFINGYILLDEDDRIILCDKKGEMSKLPSKIKSVEDFSGKYIIFESEEGCGVCDLNGEIIIRPKYKRIYFKTDDSFFAKKDGSSEEIFVLDKNGDQIGKPLDYKRIAPFGKFGYFAEEGNTVTMLGSDFKPKTKDEFYDFKLNSTPCFSVKTDYFDMAAVARNMVEMIKGNKINGITLGAPASVVFAGKSPADYKYETTAKIDDLKKTFYNYSYSFIIAFNGLISSSEWNYNSYTYNYFWNPEAKVIDVNIAMKCEKEWGTKGHEALLKALTNAGFKTEVRNDEQSTLMKKGNVLVIALSKSNGAMLVVIDGNIEGLEKEIKKDLNSLVNSF